MIDRSRVKKVFKQYVNQYDLSDVKNALKVAHTYRVAALCDRIGRSLALPEDKIDVLWACGMLHDIGRFEQVSRYGTFIDTQSIDHALLGARILFPFSDIVVNEFEMYAGVDWKYEEYLAELAKKAALRARNCEEATVSEALVDEEATVSEALVDEEAGVSGTVTGGEADDSRTVTGGEADDSRIVTGGEADDSRIVTGGEASVRWAVTDEEAIVRGAMVAGEDVVDGEVVTKIAAEEIDSADGEFFRKGIVTGNIREFMEDAQSYAAICLAIRWHSSYRLPDNLPDWAKTCAQVLRDADKIDILKVNVETPLEEIYNVSTEELRNCSVTPEVMQAFMEHHTVLRTLKKTPIDNVVGHICLTYELVYPESRRAVIEQGYLDKLLNFESQDTCAKEQMKIIREHMQGWLAEKNR